MNALLFFLADKPRLESLAGDGSPHDGPHLQFSPQIHLPVSDTAASPGHKSTAVTQSSYGPPPGPTLNSATAAADKVLFQLGLSPSQNPKAFTSSDLLAEQAVAQTTPPLRLSKPGWGPGLDEGPSSRRVRDLSLDHWKASILTISKQPPLSNTPNDSASQLILSDSGGPSASQHVLLDSDQKYVDESPPTHTQTTASLSSRLPQTPLLPVAMPGFPLDVSDGSDYPSLNDRPPNSTSPMQQDEPGRGTDITLRPPPERLVPSYLPFLSPHPTAALSQPTEALPGGDYFPTNTMDIDWGSGEYMETISFLGAEEDDLYSLVSNRPSDMYDLEESPATESYDTSFPTRVGLSLSSFHPHLASPSLSPSLTTTLIPGDSPTPVYPLPLSPSSSSSSSSSVQPTFEPTPPVHSDRVLEASEIDWSDAFAIEATALLLPDMNSIEYYTTQLAKEDNTSLNTDAAEHRGNITTISGLVSHAVSISATHLAATRTFTIDPSHMLTALFGDEGPAGNSTWVEEEFSGPYSGYEPLNETGTVNYTVLEGLQPVHMSEHFSVATPPSVVVSSSIGDVEASPTHMAPTPAATPDSSYFTPSGSTAAADATALLPDDIVLSSLPTDVYWFTTESVPLGGVSSMAAVPSASAALSPVPATTLAPNDTATLGNAAPNDTAAPGNAAPSAPPNVTVQSSSAEPSPNSTWLPHIMISDEGVSEEPTERRSTASTTAASASPEAETTSPTTLPDTTTAGATSPHLLTSIPATVHSEAITTGLSTTVVTVSQSPATTTTTTTTTTGPARQYLCSIDKPAYAVRVGTFCLLIPLFLLFIHCLFNSAIISLIISP